MPTPERVQNLLFDSFGDFAKMEEFGPKGGAYISSTPLDPPLGNHISKFIELDG